MGLRKSAQLTLFLLPIVLKYDLWKIHVVANTEFALY
jgi:hypothetical protein